MKQSSRKTLFLLLAPVCFFACARVHAQTSASVRQVTAADYCDFLNQNAAVDSDHLYDEHMATDSAVASIVRLGQPGEYFYQVIAGRENFPITYVDQWAQQKYCDSLQNSEVINNEKTDDLYLRSNQIDFTVKTTDSSQLALIPGLPVIADAAGTAAEYFWGIVGGVGIGMLWGRGAAMEEPASIDTQVASENSSVLHDEYSMSTERTLLEERHAQQPELSLEGKLITASEKRNKLLTKRSHPLSVPGLLKRVTVAFLSLAQPAFGERIIGYSLQNETTPLATLGVDSLGNFLNYHREPKDLSHHQREKDLSGLTISEKIDEELRVFENKQVEDQTKRDTFSTRSSLFSGGIDFIRGLPSRSWSFFNRKREEEIIFHSAISDAIRAQKKYLTEMIPSDVSLSISSYKFIGPENPNFEERWDKAIELQLHAIKAARDYIRELEKVKKSQSDAFFFFRDNSVEERIQYTKSHQAHTELRFFDMKSDRAFLIANAAYKNAFELKPAAADFYEILSDAILKIEQAVIASNQLIAAHEYKANFAYEKFLEHKKRGRLDNEGIEEFVEFVFGELKQQSQRIRDNQIAPLMNNLELLKSKFSNAFGH